MLKLIENKNIKYIILSVVIFLILSETLLFIYKNHELNKNMKNDYQNKSEENLQEQNLQVQKLLTLDDEEYFNIDEKVLAKLEFDLLGTDFFGVVINAPQKININEKNKLPLLIGFRRSGDVLWDYPIIEHSFLVATNLSDGKVYTIKLFNDKKEKIPDDEDSNIRKTN